MLRSLTRSDLVEKELTGSIIGAFYHVYNQLGYGFLEKIYAEALARTLRKRGHVVESEVRIPIYFEHEVVGLQKVDMLIDSKVMVENKSTYMLSDADHRQLTSYLSASEVQVGLLLHFGPKADFYRIVCTRSPKGLDPRDPQLPPYPRDPGLARAYQHARGWRRQSPILPPRVGMTKRVLLLLAALGSSACLHRDVPKMPEASVTYMVDTISPEHRDVLALWRSYLHSNPENYSASSQWSKAEQERWPIFDLAGAFIYGSTADAMKTRTTIFQIAPARDRDSTEYVIRTVFSRPDPDWGQKIIIARVYAMREDGHWVLSNAVDRMTADWKRTTFENITYVHPADHKLDTVRARMTVRYIDSLAKVFDAPRPKPITYYLARSPEEVFRINGIELYLPGSRGFSIVANYMVFSGVPKYGEFFPHELTHMVLGWVLPNYNTPAVLDEGMALWLGGGREMTWPEVRHELATEVRRDSTRTLEQFLEQRPATMIYRLSAIASLIELTHQRGGVPALKELFSSSRDGKEVDVLGGALVALKMSRREVEAAWRKSVLDSK